MSGARLANPALTLSRVARQSGRGRLAMPSARTVREGMTVPVARRRVHFWAHAGGISPMRLAMILSTIRFGRMAAIKYRIGSGVMV